MVQVIKEYDFSTAYHPGKANVVANAFSKNLSG